MSQSTRTLITGASTGIGAIYADRFARRGQDLVLVARNLGRMEALAARLRADHGIMVEIVVADLSQPEDTSRVADLLRRDNSIGTLVNNAGTALGGTFPDQPERGIADLIALNTGAVTLLAHAAAQRFAAAGGGAIVNLSSVVGLAPELGMTVYGATKAYVLYLSQALSLELGPKGVYVQAVLPAATRTEIWSHAGRDVDTMQGVMEVEPLVDAALVGFDRRETVTIPPLPDDGQWTTYNTARHMMLPNFGQTHPALRYTDVA
ncbi:AraC family transcriptional regulator [Oceanicola sp. 22II-s10i]|uniref:SDR family NAD(P)-dependent oxidoreductase n=1 Tax=Oceanicola sp. 22II-s10i TaxID=1317116 RepID=UPI000B66C45C|nr:SDR family oxidoreductase [Oceanicola sp. 22II-s10i]OWU84225.1 AraC family transcriptional regulator [Oceanicola sp. 22II-s10i]